MQILSIGNSFSCDAHSYLYRISHAEKNDLSAINLSIGGCTLERHYHNMLGCIWYETLTGKPVTCTDFNDFDVEVTPEEAALAREIAHKTVTEFSEAQRA